MLPTAISRYLKLPFSFDCARLEAELATIESSAWISHFNTSAYDKDWACVPLRSVGGRLDHIIPINEGEFADTAILAHCPYMRSVIDQFACEKTSVRLMALDAGATIKPHRDDAASLEDGLTRLHIPIRTAPEVLFYIDHEVVHFSAGDTWYLNASCLHSVENRSAIKRVHLMLDCVTNPWLEAVFKANHWVGKAPAKYGDSQITDENVGEIIAQLRQQGGAAAQQLIAQLEATQHASG